VKNINGLDNKTLTLSPGFREISFLGLTSTVLLQINIFSSLLFDILLDVFTQHSLELATNEIHGSIRNEPVGHVWRRIPAMKF